jgi:ubiquinone/menaquinone biosynthesis C-methylase UbiE
VSEFATDTTAFWSASQPGFRFTDAAPGTPEFFAEVESHRYSLEPHIPEIVRFERWAERDVLEVGCGIGTDAAQFLRAGARYTGVDQSQTALELARRRFESEGLRAERLQQTSATNLPFPDAQFDCVYSHGVIHHIRDTRAVVAEFQRVLRPGGTALVMVYHRDSSNYRINIMLIRRLLAATLLVPGAIPALARVTGESEDLMRAHRRLLREHGSRYLTDRELFLSNNTDGPGNPLSKVYSRTEVRELFGGFAHIELAIRHLNLRVIPGGKRLATRPIAERLGRRIGWHLYVQATK